MLDEEDTREAAQKVSREQVIFPDDLLPGVNSEPVTFQEAFKVGGKLMFVVLLLLLSFDELEGAAINVLAPEIRRTFGISSGTIVFIATASSAFFVLGAVPMGWLADRCKRVPIVGWASLAFGGFVFASGLAISAFMLFWTRFATGIAKANSIPVHQSLIADNYPIGIRARMSATMQMGAHGLGLASPVICAAIATWAGGTEGWRWAWFLLGIPVVIVAFLAFFMKEPHGGSSRSRMSSASSSRTNNRRPSRWRRRSPGSSASAPSRPCSSGSAPSASGSSASRPSNRCTSTTRCTSPTCCTAA